MFGKQSTLLTIESTLLTIQPTLFTFESTLQGTESPRDGKEHENGGFDPFCPPSESKNEGKNLVQQTKQHRKARVPTNRKRDKGVKRGFSE